MTSIEQMKAQILQPYQPEGGKASWEVYGEAIHALMQEAALRAAEMRALLPLVQGWENAFPIESYGVEGSLFRFIRETYRFTPVKDFGPALTVDVHGLAYSPDSEMGMAKARFFNGIAEQQDADRLKNWLIQSLEFQWPRNMLENNEDNEAPALLLSQREPQA